MNKTIRNIGVIIVCLTAIIFWIYNGFNKAETTVTDYKTEDTSNLIFRILQKDSSLHLDSMVGNSNITYSDSTNFINILKDQETIDVSIGKIAPLSTSEFLSLSYKKTTLNNYKTYLKNTNNFNHWDSICKVLNADYDFNLSELADYINEIGFFTTSNTTFYYLKTEEAYNVSSLLNFINDSSGTYISEKQNYYKIYSDNIFQLLAGKLFTENKNYYITTEDYFIFASDTSQLHYMNRSLEEENILEKNYIYSDYKSKQFSEYGLHYYSDITSENDSVNRILSYQLRGEQNFIITNLSILESPKQADETTTENTIKTDTLTKEEQIIEEIINSTTENQEEEELGEITYTLVEGQTFRQATVKLKEELAKDGYDYNKVKMEHVFFVIDNGTTKLNWNTAVKKYLDKKQPKAGDYFYMKKFFY